jgi:hypothetical protein
VFSGILVVTAAAWSHEGSGSQRIWIATPYVKLQATTTAAAWRPALVAPRGGRASFQLVVDGGRTVRPSAGALTGAHGARLAGAVSVRRELTVPITQSSAAVGHGLQGAVPDPLVPVSVRPSSGSRQVFWVSVVVPRSQRAGVYRGVVQAGGKTLPYSLRVADVTLPARHALRTWFLVWGDHAIEAEQNDDAPSLYTQLLASYGIGDGTAKGGDTAIGVEPSSLPSDASDATLQRLAARVAREAARLRSTRPDAIPYSYVADEPDSDQLPQVQRWGEALAHAAPGVRQLVTAPPDPSLGSSVGAWSMHLRDLTPAALAAAKAAGAEPWVYSSCCEDPGDPTLLIDQDAVGNLAVLPASWQLGGVGFLYWSVSDYTGDPYSDANNHGGDRVSNGDGVLIYPGRPLGLKTPNSSLRLELTAAGLQISDEAAMLAQRGQADEARALLARVLPGGTKFDDNPAGWQAVERALLRRLEH